jgi:uncharacterized protein YegL
MPRSDYADITMVLDRSGSMSIVRDDTIGGFNAFLKEQQSASGECRLTLVQFDNEYEFVHQGKPVAEVPPLNTTTFVPRGSTALLDAIGRAVNETGARLSAMAEHERPGKVVFVIITDGQENSSREFTRDKVNGMIAHQRESYQWEFVFLGANQDAIQTGASLGVHAANAMTYAQNTAGVLRAFESTSRNLTSLRSGSKSSMAYGSDDRDAQKQAGAC